MITRRELLKRGTVGGAGLILLRAPLAAAAGNAKLPQFSDALPVPGAQWDVIDLRQDPALGLPNPSASIGVSEFAVPVHSALPAQTTVWGYGSWTPRSTYLGPTVIVTRNQAVDITYANELPANRALIAQDPNIVPAVPNAARNRINTHLHGGHIEDASDGNPFYVLDSPAGAKNASEVVPGDSQTMTYTNDQATALLFYHDHALGVTRTNVYAGIAGGYVITDAQDPGPTVAEGSLEWNGGLRLPGAGYDIPLVLQDRQLDLKTGQLVYPAGPGSWVPEFFGDTVLVNGKAWPFLNVKRRKYRFRVLNGSNSRFYNLDFGPGVKVQKIGNELGRFNGGPVDLTSPKTVLVAPAERADIVVDFSTAAPNKRQVTVTDLALPAGTVSPTKPIGPIMQFRMQPAGPTPVPDPSQVPGNLDGPALPTGENDRRWITLDEILGQGGKPVAALLNNTHFADMAGGTVIKPVTETPKGGDTEVWEFINLTADTHPIHVHLVHFEVIERQALDVAAYQARLDEARANDPSAVLVPDAAELGAVTPAPPEERSIKDTVRVNPAEVTRIRLNFDRMGKYVYHCHILEHEENEMMRPFEVA